MKKRLSFLAMTLCIVCMPAVAEDNWVSLEKTTGKGLFHEKCGMCHGDAMGMGTGILARRMPADEALLESRTNLQGPYIANVVRAGLGVMFPLSRGEVSDEQLDKIIQYLVKED